MEWATPIPGNTTVYGGAIRTSSEASRRQLRSQKENLFEQLLLFESVNFSINGPNTIIPLLYRSMGDRVLEDLLDQDALTFTVWTPQPMMSHQNGRVAATFVGRIGDGHGSELDIERIVDNGLTIQQVGMPDWYKRQIRTKLIARHRLLDEKLPETAWQVAEKALAGGELEEMSLGQRPTILGSTTQDGVIFTKAADSILSYRYVLENGMASQNDPGLVEIFGLGVKRLKATNSRAAKYAIVSEYEKFPNLRTMYGKLDDPFRVVSSFRSTYTARRFREWLATSADTISEIDVIRDYVDACGKRRGMFESAPAKFLKLTGMIAIGHIVLPDAHLLGEALGALLAGIPAEALGTITETTSEFGLGVIDSFIVDNFKVGWTPRAYFDRLRRFQHHAMPKVEH
jgi:hypothetical protein